MVKTIFTEMQLFKGVQNYFTDSLLYKENGKVVEKPLPNGIDSCNEADSESGDDSEVSFKEELTVVGPKAISPSFEITKHMQLCF